MRSHLSCLSTLATSPLSTPGARGLGGMWLGCLLVASLAVACGDGDVGDDPTGGEAQTAAATTSSASGQGGGAGVGGGDAGGGDAGGGDTGGSDAGGGGAGGGVVEGWGEAEPGVTVGPFGYFKAFRSGCGEQMWMRFIANEDFALGEINAQSSGGGGVGIQFFETPTFSEAEKSVYLVNDSGGWGEGTGTFTMKVGYANQSVLTHVVEAPIDPLFRWNGQIDFASARMDGSKGLQVTIDPKISGNIGRLFLYDPDECVLVKRVLLETQTITTGSLTEVDVGASNLESGQNYTLVLQGVDSARAYTYYATLDVPAP